MKKPDVFFRFLLAGFMLLLLAGCFQKFYKTEKPPNDKFSEAITTGISANKYFIIHQHENFYKINDLQVDQQAKTISFSLADVDPDHTYYSLPGKGRTYKKSQAGILNEVHLYTTDTTAYTYGIHVRLPMSQLTGVEVLNKNTAATTGNTILSVGLVLVTLVALFGLVAGEMLSDL